MCIRDRVVRSRAGGQHNTATLPAIGRDPADLPRKRHAATYVLFAMAVVAALVLVGLAGKALFTGNAGAPQLTVPSVINMTQAQAQAKLSSVGFKSAVSLATNPAEKLSLI